MSDVSKRAFRRDTVEVSISYAFFNTEQYFEATMYNSSEGGMYFETDYHLEAGSDILIKITDYSPDIYGIHAMNGYRAEVMWCRKIYKEDAPSRYGVGVRFMVNVCNQCGQTVAYSDIHKTENFLFLCSNCLSQLRMLADSDVKSHIENYLLGNVV